jgi:hypothetical protein
LAFKKRSFGKKKIQIFLLSVSSEEKLLNLQTKKKKKKKKKKNLKKMPKKERLVWTTVHVQEVQSSVLENLDYTVD